jgi:anti-sigma factor RsiW
MPVREGAVVTTKDEGASLSCRDCGDLLQDYVDGDLARDVAVRVFLHVRGCARCEAALQEWQSLVAALGTLDVRTPPEGFDEAVLAAVPYAAYREMAGLRRVRVPVYLEPSFLPAWLRAPVLRAAGLVVAGAGAAGFAADLWSVAAAALLGLGVLPEVLVRTQGWGRRLALRQQPSEGGR